MDPGQEQNNVWDRRPGSHTANLDNPFANTAAQRYYSREALPQGPFFVGPTNQQAWGGPPQQENDPPFVQNSGRYPEAQREFSHQPAFTFPPGAERGGWKHHGSNQSPTAISSPANYNFLGGSAGGRVGDGGANDWMGMQFQGGEWQRGDAWAQRGGYVWPAEAALWNAVSDRPEREQGKFRSLLGGLPSAESNREFCFLRGGQGH